MRALTGLLFLLFFLVTSCDKERLYEQNFDFNDRFWELGHKVKFDFIIKDYARSYNLYYLIRNSPDFPFSRIFIEYTLRDAEGNDLRKQLKYDYLFDQKTGKPYGEDGLGSVFSHQFPLLLNYRFKQSGKHTVLFEPFNRVDTLQGVLSVGLRVEYADEGGT